MNHPLTRKQAQIVLSRFKKQEPLNLHFMLREFPDIMARVFPEENPVGWRKTLLALDIDPYAIEHELQQYVTCSKCGESFECLLHHLKIHKMNADSYRNEFGDNTEFYSEVYRYRATDHRAIIGVEHWELIWSGEYLIDLLLAIDEIPGGMRKLTSARGGSALNKAVKYFGSWTNALERAGIDRSKPQSTLSLNELKKRIDAFLIKKKDEPYLKTPSDIAVSLEKHFDSTRDAAEALGFDQRELVDRKAAAMALAEEAAAELMTLANKRGILRRKALFEIWDKYRDHLRGIFYHSKGLAIEMGVPLYYIDKRTYRDLEDVHHDLDLVEAAGIELTGPNLFKFNLNLYRTVMNNPEARKRLVS